MLNKKHIIFFTPGLVIGGVERVMVNYANLLADCGFKTTYLTLHEKCDFNHILSDKVSLCNLKTNKLRKSAWKIAKFLKKSDAAYIMTGNAATSIIVLAKIMANSKIKILASHHSYINSETNFIDRYIFNHLYNTCYKVIAISDGIERFLLQHKVKKEKIVKLYNPIDFDAITKLSNQFNFRPDSSYIVFVGRICEVKRIDLLICAFSNLPDKSLKLIIIGDGPCKNSLIDLTKKLDVYSRVDFLGIQENPYPYIKNAKIVALSSESEAFPTILIEGLLLGKTIVSTPVPGAIEILHDGQLGYISKSHSIDDYYQTLLKAIKKPMDSSFLITKTKEYYSPQITINKFKQLICNK